MCGTSNALITSVISILPSMRVAGVLNARPSGMIAQFMKPAGEGKQHDTPTNSFVFVCYRVPGPSGAAMKLIEVSNGRFFAMVDDDDYGVVSKHKWYARKTRNGRVWHARTPSPWPERETIYMHRLILGAQKGQQVDHIDHNGLNNTRSNLRLCDATQNLANARFIPGLSGFRGVQFLPKSGRWRARIIVRKKHISLGCYADRQSAADAYRVAAQKYFGEFAVRDSCACLYQNKGEKK